MTSNGGLSRRRVPAGGSSSTLKGADDEGSQTSPSVTSNGGSGTSSPTPIPSHAGSAFEGGSKVAFDPRDIERDNEDQKQGGRIPRLTLVEEVLLLGLKDKQGYLSFWNDNISYVLRGCILIELALRRRIALVKDANRRRNSLSERLVEVIDDRQTGETILDETLRMMKNQQETEKISINSWVDLLSGETWNVLKIGFQLKQVRERLAKGLVDKGVLRTEKRNFLLFDMATHPIADVHTKGNIISRIVHLLTATTTAVPSDALDKEGTQCRVIRAVCLACASYAASVLDNAFGRLGYKEREAAFQRCDDVLAEFACWPFGSASGSGGTQSSRRREAANAGSDGSRQSVLGLLQEVKGEMHGDEDLGFELVAGVLEVLAKLDSLL